MRISKEHSLDIEIVHHLSIYADKNISHNLSIRANNINIHHIKRLAHDLRITKSAIVNSKELLLEKIDLFYNCL